MSLYLSTFIFILFFFNQNSNQKQLYFACWLRAAIPMIQASFITNASPNYLFLSTIQRIHQLLKSKSYVPNPSNHESCFRKASYGYKEAFIFQNLYSHLSLFQLFLQKYKINKKTIHPCRGTWHGSHPARILRPLIFNWKWDVYFTWFSSSFF